MLLTTPINDDSRTLAVRHDGMPDEYMRVSVVDEVHGILTVPRDSIRTPVDCCPVCHTPNEFRAGRQIKCPFHERHMYEDAYARSHSKQHTRHERRQYARAARIWGGKWKARKVHLVARATDKIKKQMKGTPNGTQQS